MRLGIWEAENASPDPNTVKAYKVRAPLCFGMLWRGSLDRLRDAGCPAFATIHVHQEYQNGVDAEGRRYWWWDLLTHAQERDVRRFCQSCLGAGAAGICVDFEGAAAGWPRVMEVVAEETARAGRWSAAAPKWVLRKPDGTVWPMPGLGLAPEDELGRRRWLCEQVDILMPWEYSLGATERLDNRLEWLEAARGRRCREVRVMYDTGWRPHAYSWTEALAGELTDGLGDKGVSATFFMPRKSGSNGAAMQAARVWY